MILELLMGLTGLFFGVILSIIAEEEIIPGKKYFYLLKRIMFCVISISIVYLFRSNLFLMIIFIILSIILFILELKLNNYFVEIFNYIFFILAYILNTKQDLYTIFATLIFIYGFPVGTLIWPQFKPRISALFQSKPSQPKSVVLKHSQSKPSSSKLLKK
ncbi:MAG: hypothetical protein ABIH82_03320 [Candidatus Woesearchaeota archaeon]